MGMIYNPYSLEGKTILITGASSGIGRGAAIECSKMGAKVIVTARNEERLKETLSQLEGDGHEMRVFDLNDIHSIKDFVSGLPELQGVINNAGFTSIQPIPFIDENIFMNIMNVNTMAPVLILKYLIKKKKLKSGASVVFTSSLAGIGKMSVGNTMYGCSKGAISAFIQGAAKELAAKNIRVNAVCPAMVESRILDSGTISSEQMAKNLENYPMGFFGKPEDVAWGMIYLLSDAARWVTGINLPIDGGRELI